MHSPCLVYWDSSHLLIHFDLIIFQADSKYFVILVRAWTDSQYIAILVQSWPCHHNTQESSQGWECCWDCWARISSALLALISTSSPGRPGNLQLIAPRQLTWTTRRRWRYIFHSTVGMLFSWHGRGYRVQGLVGIFYNRRRSAYSRE